MDVHGKDPREVEVAQRDHAVHPAVDRTVDGAVYLPGAVVEEEGIDVGRADAQGTEESDHADVPQLLAQAPSSTRAAVSPCARRPSRTASREAASRSPRIVWPAADRASQE